MSRMWTRLALATLGAIIGVVWFALAPIRGACGVVSCVIAWGPNVGLIFVCMIAGYSIGWVAEKRYKPRVHAHS